MSLSKQDRKKILPSSMTLLPLPPRAQNFLSDMFGGLEFEWVLLRVKLQIPFYGVKPRNPKENFRFSKVSQTGLGVLSSKGGGGVIKSAKTVNFY